jgi:hypothetical protein
MKKHLPIGISDFYTLIDENYYFADKSLFIKEIIESKDSKTLLLPRPRRFGKTLNISMLKYFFTPINKDKNRKLFDGLFIENEPSIMELQGKIPVIYLSFKDVKAINWQLCYKSFVIEITRAISNFEYLRNHKGINESDKILLNKLFSFQADQTDIENSLRLLTKLLHEYHGVKPIILIDEYDQPIISSYTNGYFKEGISFFRNFYSGALKDNQHLEKAVMTGILRIAKESIFSGLNNLKVDSIIRNQLSFFGLTEDEVQEILDPITHMDYELKEVQGLVQWLFIWK